MSVLALRLGFETISICSTFTIFFGSSIFSYRYLPKGDCRLCCPIDKENDVTFNLFTRRNPVLPQQIFKDAPWTLSESHFNSRHPTVFYIHGFTERGMGISSRTVKQAYLDKGDFNVIVVDWGPLSSFPYYAASARNTRLVGYLVADFIRFLASQGAAYSSQIHIVGFSLGAEVASFAGKILGPGSLARITDPAFPLYIYQGQQGHLTSTDAQFVDVIHTDGGVFGFPSAIGHADFFPNGGVAMQPGCRLQEVTKRGHPDEVVACSHNRAWMYYAESVVHEDAFPATPCTDADAYYEGKCNSSWAHGVVLMGYAANPRYHGRFFLATRSEPPFTFRRRSL